VIETIIEMIASLIERGFAYQSGGDVYFRVARDDDYGKLSGRRLEDMIAGARVDINERKEDPLDFALWKAAKPGEPFWDSPWGDGRPGWHIECSAMNMKFLGSQIDIHGGGNDLIFPHHENEIAQTESLTGEPMARYWAHNGMLQLSGEKMSKSIGNLITVADFLSRHEADALRMMVLNSGYRRPLQYSEEIVLQAERALERLRNALRPAQVEAADVRSTGPEGNVENLKGQTESAREGFLRAMDDDFNTAGALGHIFDLVRVINHARDAGGSEEDLQPAQDAVRELCEVLGLSLEKPSAADVDVAPFIDLLLSLRADLRERKNWELADQIRDRLVELGIILEDSNSGTVWRKA
jgi:cysteinyl-tRNA synthetase